MRYQVQKSFIEASVKMWMDATVTQVITKKAQLFLWEFLYLPYCAHTYLNKFLQCLQNKRQHLNSHSFLSSLNMHGVRQKLIAMRTNVREGYIRWTTAFSMYAYSQAVLFVIKIICNMVAVVFHFQIICLILTHH